jgi:DNA mismatch endonuclease (patch repair protein)
MAPFWQEKIAKNRARDRKNFLALRRQGWRVLRIWQHEIKANPDRCVQRIVDALAERRLTELTTRRKRTDSESVSANKLGR